MSRTPLGARVAIYARYSSDKQSEASIEDQVRRCRDHVALAGGDPDAAQVFTDYAVSGASLHRSGFEALMRAVDAGAVEAIVTEDISRISRDLADSAHLFKRLQFARVPLIGVADGIDTSSRHAKLSFTVKSLVADLYLDDLRDKTLRGLEGRALAGLATGNVPFGYRTAPAPDGKGHRIEIDPEAAELVRRIFGLYASGRSYGMIATQLNAEGVPPPRAKTKHQGSKGWGITTVRAMLDNDRYIGAWRFKETTWIKVPGTNRRVPRKRDASEVISQERPELRIVPPELWSAVRKRRTGVRDLHARTGRNSIATRAVYPLSGLLHCAACGAPMTIFGGTRTAKRYRCAYQVQRGTCDNALSVREDVARRCIVDGVKARLLRPEGLAFVRQEMARRMGELNRGLDAELKERRARLARTEDKIRGLVEFIATGDRSDYVVSTMRDLEAHAKQEKAAIAELVRQARQPIALPSLDALTAAVGDLDALLAEDPIGGRTALHRLFQGGRIDLDPQPDGVYLARSKLLPLAAIAGKQLGETTGPRRYNEGVAGAGFEPATFGL
jgi:site-specific DNA recombinase